ncbi:hypothetical protein C0585_07595 [Candidatus Woesearchaeota archaeon]|nr:MAG: hypothetical protein C0585_07595 [Candidatus Woesearchaeota archaeon]
MKKIAIIGYNFNHPNGNIRNSLPFIEMCKKHKDIEIHLIMPRYWKDHQKNWQKYDNKTYEDLKIKNLKIYKLDSFFSGHEWLYYLKDLEKTLKKIKPDTILSEDDYFMINTYKACKFAKKQDIPFLNYSWDNLFINTYGPFKYFEKFILKNTTKFIAGTKDVRKVMIRKGISSKNIVVIPQSGVNLDFFKPKEVKKEYILYAGQISEHKGIDTILNAIKILKKENIEWHFLGKGPLKDKILKISKRNKNIKVHDWVDYEKMPEFLSKAKIFLYPSIPTKIWEEQYGFAMLEAMACGVPVIASNTSGPNAIIENKKDGILIDVDDEEALARNIDELSKDKKKYSLIRDNAMIKAKELSLLNISEKFYLLFKKIID